MKTGDIYHLADPMVETRPTCGATLTKWVSPLPTLDRSRVNCPVCLSIMAEHTRVIPLTLTEYNRITGVGSPTPLHKPPLMNEKDDGVFEFYDVHEGGDWPLEVVPQTTGNVEFTMGQHLFTLSHLDRADLIRALLHDFHYSPERGGPNGN